MARSEWTDLLDPDEATLRDVLPGEVRPEVVRDLLRPAEDDGSRVRPSIRSHGNYVLGILLVAVAVPEEDLVYYQEVDFVLTRERIVTVRKTPASRPARSRSTWSTTSRSGSSTCSTTWTKRSTSSRRTSTSGRPRRLDVDSLS